MTPQEVIRVWKTEFATFWPKGQKMFLPATGIAPGEVGLINATLPGAPTMATGILVIYADDESFSFMSPEGHPIAGPLTFSAYTDDSGVTVAQATATSYCLETNLSGTLMHEAGPGGSPSAGHC